MPFPFLKPGLDPSQRVENAVRTLYELDDELQAFAWRVPRDLTCGEQTDGPLAGLAFGVKDVIDVAGMPTRAGSLALPGENKLDDAACVAQLRAAGAKPVGKTVTAEFAFTTPGPTRNPHRLDHTPGGSSSGSAAAVAAGIVEMALGTQTGGSMIRPAAFCGVVGFKPTFGRVHRAGMQVLCDSLDTVGWFTRTIEQSQAIAAVLLPAQPTSLARPSPHVAVVNCASLGALSPAAEKAFNMCAAHLRGMGAKVASTNLEANIDLLTRLHGIVMRYELARGLMPIAVRAGDKVSRAAREVVREGLAIDYQDYLSAQQRRRELSDRWLDVFAEVDFIIAPSAPGEAPAGLHSTGSSVFNRLWSLLGWPCLHLPTALGEHGLPVGVQWVGKPDTEATLLHWARLIGPPLACLPAH